MRVLSGDLKCCRSSLCELFVRVLLGDLCECCEGLFCVFICILYRVFKRGLSLMA